MFPTETVDQVISFNNLKFDNKKNFLWELDRAIIIFSIKKDSHFFSGKVRRHGSLNGAPTDRRTKRPTKLKKVNKELQAWG